MSIRSTVLLLLLPFSTTAQVEGLINDNDIIWAAEVEAAVRFDDIDNSPPSQVLEAVPVKTIQDKPDAPALHPFTEKLKSMIAQGAFNAYADSKLQNPITHSEAMARLVIIDTIVVFDPETYEEKIHIVKKEILGSVSFFVTRQLWLYNGKKNELETVALAIAPAVENPARPGSYKTLAWFQLPPPKKSLSRLKSAAVQFATHVRYDVAEGQMEVLKGEDNHLKQILISRLKTGELTGYDLQRRPIAPSEAEGLFVQQDTIITFDPETYEENVQVVRMEFGPLDITDFRIQQNWLFAPSRNSLQCIPTALGPAIPIIDEYGAQLALQPLFFWRKE